MRRFLQLFALFLLCASAVWAGPQSQIGPYTVEVTTDPGVIPVGKAQLQLRVTAGGKPVEGARITTLTKMPAMDMGEREQPARALDAPGLYQAPAAFSMGGAYDVNIQISGPQGEASGKVALSTGQNTATASDGGFRWRWLVGLVVILAAAFVFTRMRRTGQHFNARAVFNRQVVGGLALLGAMFLVAVYAVNHFRRPGSMTPIQAQAMEMDMPAPEGALPVALATVTRGEVSNTVRYTGQAVGFLEQDVYPRVQGTLETMPFYAGDKVTKGQVLARLDTSQIAPLAAETQAAVGVAQSNAAVTKSEAQGAQSAVGQARNQLDAKNAAVTQARSDERKARAALSQKRGALSEAQNMARRAGADLTQAQSSVQSSRAQLAQAQSDAAAARAQREGAQADVAAVQSRIEDANAQVAAAQADLELARAELARQQMLYQGGAAPQRNVDVAQANIENAKAKVRQAQAGVAAVEASVSGAQAKVRSAEALIQSAQAKARGAQADIGTNQARIEAAKADQGAATARVVQARADVQGAGEEIGSVQAQIKGAQADVAAQNSQIKQTQSAADAARGRIEGAQAQTKQAQAAAQSAAATLGYAEIRAQLDGVVTQRLISPGTLVTPGHGILKIAQINPIRLQANVAESDLKRIEVGAPVQVKSSADATKSITARVTSIAPAVDPQSRTGLVEAIVQNPDAKFKPGEYVVMQITTGQVFGALKVPSRAIRYRTTPSGGTVSTSDDAYVWVAQPVGGTSQMMAQRVAVKVQSDNGQSAAIIGGIKEGAQVVTSPAQSLTNGITIIAAGGDKMTMASDAATAPDKVQKIAVALTENGYQPATLNLRANVPAQLTFTRKTEATCGTEVQIPEFNIRKKLPLNQPVTIEFTPKKRATLAFGCGMDMMIHGKLVVN